jgi:hypothetical protein
MYLNLILYKYIVDLRPGEFKIHWETAGEMMDLRRVSSKSLGMDLEQLATKMRMNGNIFTRNRDSPFLSNIVDPIISQAQFSITLKSKLLKWRLNGV